MPQLGSHRMPTIPARPPARPTATLPEDRDEVTARLFAAEFEAVPMPDRRQAKAQRTVCDASNMTYIKSALPISIRFEYEQFFEQMARRLWSAARPSAGAARLMSAGNHRQGTAPDMSRPRMPGGVATDWKKIPELARVNAYAFRGDKRRPTEIRASGGFHPPSSRTDDRYVTVTAERFVKYMKDRFGKDVDQDEVVRYIKGQGAAGKAFVEYEIWRSILDSEKMHVGRMVADEFMKGFISTTRNVDVAYSFAVDASEDGYKSPTFTVYAVHSNAGFLLPPLTQHVHGSKQNEAEIAHPGSIPWLQVMAFRSGMNYDFVDDRLIYHGKVVFVRRGFRQADPRGFSEVVTALASLEM
jgi:hypothetical protein